MKTIERKGDSSLRDIVASQDVPDVEDDQRLRRKISILWPIAVLSAMATAILLLDAVLPLRDFWFHEATLTQLGIWPAWPSLLLFPGWSIIAPVPFMNVTGTPDVLQSWAKLPLLLDAFLIVFVVYLVAVRYLPQYISWRYLWRSTVALGILYMLIPAVTSPDLYSYIAYARIGVLYHLNPLTTIPTAIHSDVIYKYIFWVDQPSAYGPTWAIIACFLQWAISLFGNTRILPMVIALRVLGFAMHLLSTWLVWSITGKMYHLGGHDSTFAYRKRLGATLAFAWNPLLLFEACVNAHNDAVLLVFVLLVIWALVHEKTTASGRDITDARPYIQTLVAQPVKKLIERIPADLRTPVAAAVLLALATCMKINAVLLFPGLALYVWMQSSTGRHIKRALTTVATYAGVIVLFYLPFWQDGAIFSVFQVNPATYRTINTPADFLAHFYNSMAALFGFVLGVPLGSPAERFMHTFSIGIFVLLYLVILWRAVRAPNHIGTLHELIHWMALTWLLYCAIGSPWFWPWYIVVFFGLFALLEASGKDTEEMVPVDNPGSASTPWQFWPLHAPWMARLLVFSMLSLYCFMTWGPLHTFVPGFPGFQWSFLGGLWAWLIPLTGAALLIRLRFLTKVKIS